MESGYQDKPLHDYNDDSFDYLPIVRPSNQPKKRHSRSFIFLLCLCILLGIGNIYQSYHIHKGTYTYSDVSPYAKLPRNVPVPWTLKTPWSRDIDNDTETIAMWDKIDIDPGTIALSESVVSDWDLPAAQRFPWDSHKGIYLVNGFHNLHCLKKLYRSVYEARNGLEQTTPWEHAVHCIDAMRQEVLCNADDTPRYTGMDQPEKSSGLGQVRMCRDWNKLVAWTKEQEREGCFRYGIHQKMRAEYKFCSADSPYMTQIESLYGPRPEWILEGLN